MMYRVPLLAESDVADLRRIHGDLVDLDATELDIERFRVLRALANAGRPRWERGWLLERLDHVRRARRRVAA